VIIFLLLIYVAILFGLVKIKIIKLNTFWKVSPVLYVLVLLIFLFIPMQWGAPLGTINMYQEILEVIPNVNGEVSEIVAEPLKPLKKGDTIFTIDATTYQATVDNVEAQLALAKLRLEQSSTLADKNAGSKYDVEQFESTIKQLEAQLVTAKWNLEETVVKAPADGYVTALALQKGQRVSNLPLRSWVSYVKEKRIPILWIPQIYLRHVQPGQEVEITWKLQPGRIYSATVVDVAKAIGQGQWLPTGNAPTAPNPNFPGHFPVVIKVKDDQDAPAEKLYGGAFGTAAIYTTNAKFAHIIRRVIIRMEAWMNYIKPY